MPTVTRATLRSKARTQADMVGRNFVTDTEFNAWIEEEARDLYDIVLDNNEDYETISTVLTIASGNTAALPADFYKLRGVDYYDGNRYWPLKRFELQERGDYTPEAPGQFRIWYAPEFVGFVDDNATIDGRNGWDKVIYLGAAIKALLKEESDVKDITKLYEDARNQAIERSKVRDRGEPERIVDTRHVRGPLYFYRLIGNTLHIIDTRTRGICDDYY